MKLYQNILDKRFVMKQCKGRQKRALSGSGEALEGTKDSVQNIIGALVGIPVADV